MIHLKRPGNSCGGCYCCGYCSADELEVQAPAGRVVGHVRQDPSGILHPWFNLLDSEESVVLRIKGPFLGLHGLEAEFEVEVSFTIVTYMYIMLTVSCTYT